MSSGALAKRTVIQSALAARDISEQHPVGKHPAEIYKGQKGHAEVSQAVAEILFAEFEYYGEEYQEGEEKTHEHEVKKRAYDQKQGNGRDINLSRLPYIGARKLEELNGAKSRNQAHQSEIVNSPVVEYEKKYRYGHDGKWRFS